MENTETKIETPTTVAQQDDGSRLALQKAEFEWDQRQVKWIMTSDLVPATYRGNLANALIAYNMAKRTGMDVLQVMQNLYVIHGNPSWSAQMAIALFNATKRFSFIEYTEDGDGEDYGCTASAIVLATGQKITGPKVDWHTVKAEGWLSKNGSKWKSNPKQMFRYRSATYLIRTVCPEVLLGLYVADELNDTFGEETPATTRKPVKKAKERIHALSAEKKTLDVAHNGEVEGLSDNLPKQTVETPTEAVFDATRQNAEIPAKTTEEIRAEEEARFEP